MMRGMTHIAEFLRPSATPGEPRTTWSTGSAALDEIVWFEPGRVWVVAGVGTSQLLCQWAYDLAVVNCLPVNFIGTRQQPEGAYRHWFSRNAAAYGHAVSEPPLSAAGLDVQRGDPSELVDAWLVGACEGPGVIVAETAGCSCVSTDWFRPLLWAGRLVIVAVPRACCFDWHPPVGDPLESHGVWMAAADVVLDLSRGDHDFVDVTIHKNRGGATGTVTVRFSPNSGRFHDLSEADLGGRSVPLPGLA